MVVEAVEGGTAAPSTAGRARGARFGSFQRRPLAVQLIASYLVILGV